MKIIIPIMCMLIFTACSKKYPRVNHACGVENPTENIQWLKDLVAIAETDTTGHYIGTIYLEEYLGEDVFFIQMSMGSGGVAGYWYNCDGTSITDYDDTLSPTGLEVIYSNIFR